MVKKDSTATDDTKDNSNTVRKLLVESMLKSVQAVLKQREQDQQPGKNCLCDQAVTHYAV